MKTSDSIIPAGRVEQSIQWLRGDRVIIDADLAALFGVSTKALNQAVKRNRDRFPVDFMFRLNRQEKEKLVTDCDHLGRLKFSSTLPLAFTEHGAIMAANVLNSERAVIASVAVVRAFIRIRNLVATNASLSEKLDALEKKYDRQFRVIFDAIRELMQPPPEPVRAPIGFQSEMESRAKRAKAMARRRRR